MTESKTIHTLNARSNVMLEVMREFFELNPAKMQREIQDMRQLLEHNLKAKGIAYNNLRSALVPDRKRREIAMVFDTMSIESNWYGREIFKRIIPLLNKNSNHSILTGDYLDHPGQDDNLFEAFKETVQLRRDTEYQHPTQFFIVYFNNLTEKMIARFDKGLSCYEAYVGYADTTYASRFKTYISTMLVNLGIKHGTTIIQGHESDRDECDDVNMCGYPFEEAGFTCRSVNGDIAGILLSYKIERAVFPGFETDTEFSLNAISRRPLPLDNFDVEVAEAKLTYIKKEKKGSVEKAGLENVSAAELEKLIKDKISASYIYNLVFNEKHNIEKFNIILELPSQWGLEPTRLLAALEYKPEEQKLRLLTLY